MAPSQKQEERVEYYMLTQKHWLSASFFASAQYRVQISEAEWHF